MKVTKPDSQRDRNSVVIKATTASNYLHVRRHINTLEASVCVLWKRHRSACSQTTKGSLTHNRCPDLHKCNGQRFKNRKKSPNAYPYSNIPTLKIYLYGIWCYATFSILMPLVFKPSLIPTQHKMQSKYSFVHSPYLSTPTASPSLQSQLFSNSTICCTDKVINETSLLELANPQTHTHTHTFGAEIWCFSLHS